MKTLVHGHMIESDVMALVNRGFDVMSACVLRYYRKQGDRNSSIVKRTVKPYPQMSSQFFPMFLTP